jgi:hypothetical protein
LQAALLKRQSPQAVFDSFCSSRLEAGADVFGLQGASAPLDALIQRAMPQETL